jgi:hypothetical protein
VQPLFSVTTFTDGGNVPDAWDEIVAAWQHVWDADYGQLGSLAFEESVDLKSSAGAAKLPNRSRKAAEVRNPDLLFVVDGLSGGSAQLELGGVEITAHAPDGSNIEKRYPFLWAARRAGLSAIVATPYQKQRANNQINRLPYRSARRNLELALRWTAADPESGLIQILPLRSLQDQRTGVVPAVECLLWTWADLGALLAHRLAVRAGPDAETIAFAGERLTIARARLIDLHKACMTATTETSASSLLIEADRVIQTYNARPESGHWERGEGQFDSIDGRLMVTLDDLELFEPRLADLPFQFWLPQIARGHPWIAEQRARGYGSKRLHNILVTLAGLVNTRFADELSPSDWALLRANPRLCLEREDHWKSGLYRVIDATRPDARHRLASHGIAKAPLSVRAAIESLLNDANLFYASFRGYDLDWERRLAASLLDLPSTSRVLVPRLPRSLVDGISCQAKVVAAEECSKTDLMMLRQLHRFRQAVRAPWQP